MIVIGVSAESAERLDLACKTVKAKVNAQSCKAESLKFMQLEGLVAELPLGNNPLPMTRTLTTNSAAILIPFTTQEVFEPRGLFYGSNARSGNPIVADRRAHMNSNGFILGTSGGSKSFTVKQEIAGMFLNRDDEIIIIDPEREYLPLAQAFGGQIVRISAGSESRLNPLDVVLEETGDGDPVKEKTNNVVSMIGSLVGGNEGLDPMEKSLVDRCALGLYVRFREQGADPAAQPTLGDLRDMLEATGETAGHELAVSLGSYTSGSLSGFNGQTNVDLGNRFTVFDVSGLTGELRTFGIMVVIDQVWNRVIRNRAQGRRTWLYIDEFHRFFGNEYSAGQFKDIYKRAQIRARRHGHHAEHRGAAAGRRRKAHAVQLGLPDAAEPERLRRGRTVLAAEALRGATPVLHRGAARPGAHEDRRHVRAVRRTHPVRRHALQALLDQLPGIRSGGGSERTERVGAGASSGWRAAPRRARSRRPCPWARTGPTRPTDWATQAPTSPLRATATAGRAARRGVGKAAKAGRAAMNRNRDEYKARLRAGRASLRIGKRIGSGASHVGGRGLDAVGKADASLMQADTDDSSRIGTASRDLAFRAGRAGVKGITSSSRFMWRHRKAPVKTAKATAGGARATVRAARALAVHAELGRSVDGRPGRTARQGPEHVKEPEYR